ncbi:MAG: DUF455 family protein [Bdellovibrionaceae bacterium]|nr:DUF455 family protein [Pseudobdellovibrionaceae bacterium]
MNGAEWFRLKAARDKISTIESAVADLLQATDILNVPAAPGRDVEARPSFLFPPKPKLSSQDGQGRLLHDVANIELQAMELAMRTLGEYPEAPRAFREELADLAVQEAKHLRLCLDAMDEIDRPWGTWPIHLALWEQAPLKATTCTSLIERIFVVHRHMEGSGLDAGSAILTRLSGVGRTRAKAVVQLILKEEVDHVAFGTKWYRTLCLSEGLDPDGCFSELLPRALANSPRTEKPDMELRRKAGFSEFEIQCLLRTHGFSI